MDLIVRTHSSFPAADVWLRYDQGFRRKAACSPVPLDWGATNLEVFHQAYVSSNVLQPPPSSLSPFRRSADTLRAGEAHSSPSGSEVCRAWNNGRCTSSFSQYKRRHECARCHGRIAVSTAPPMPTTVVHALLSLNGIVDALSRFQLQRFWTLAPQRLPSPHQSQPSCSST